MTIKFLTWSKSSNVAMMALFGDTNVKSPSHIFELFAICQKIRFIEVIVTWKRYYFMFCYNNEDDKICSLFIVHSHFVHVSVIMVQMIHAWENEILSLCFISISNFRQTSALRQEIFYIAFVKFFLNTLFLVYVYLH